MKLPHYQDYRTEDTERCEQALLTVWAKLRDFAEDVVLIGGLVPRYICVNRPDQYPARTLDVDIGIALCASTGLYDPISVRLTHEDFERKASTAHFEKAFGNVTLHVDFLTEKQRDDDPDTRMVDDIPAQAIMGIDRALALARTVRISGRDLRGAEVTEHVRIREVGPFIVLKLAAYAGRAAGKDVFDVVRCALDYSEGYEEAIRLFRAEAGVNGAHFKAEQILADRFAFEAGKGPVDYAEFCLAAQRGQLNDGDFRQLYQQRIQEVLLLSKRLQNG